MKKYFIFFISLIFLSCTSEKQRSSIDICPEVFFSKEHRVYITTEENSLTLNNISYKAEINNYNFVNGCLLLNNKITSALSILFVITPDRAQKAEIIIPYYIALLDKQKNLVDIQYYKVEGVLKKNVNESFFIETEIIATENVIIPTQGFNTGNKNELLIGFMLNQEKLKILN